MANEMTPEQARLILQAQTTTADFQAKAQEETTKRLTLLAERLEPLVPILEGLIGGLDGTVTRLETVTMAQVKVNQQLRQLYLVEKEEQEREEREGKQQAVL